MQPSVRDVELEAAWVKQVVAAIRDKSPVQAAFIK